MGRASVGTKEILEVGVSLDQADLVEIKGGKMVFQAGVLFEQMCKNGDKEAAWLWRQQTPPADKGDGPVEREK